MTHVLPERPHLSHLKAQAKDLLTAQQAGDSAATERIRPFFDSSTTVGLSEAQLVIAREYGFDSWAKLKEHVELRTGDLGREEAADRLAASAMQGASMESNREAILARLAETPELATASFAAACATGAVEAVRAFLAEGPNRAHDKIGEKEWEPLLYVCFSCLLNDATYRPRLVETAKVLLAAGADPNAHWLNPEWDNYPESCLYGASGAHNIPELVELLLQAGATPNDGESMYHSAELSDSACLKLLLDHGGDIASTNVLARLLDFEKPDWVRMMLSYAKDPAQIPPVFPHALRRGRATETFRALIESGMSLNTRDANGLTPYQSAVRLGRAEVADLLAKAGADTTLTPIDTILGRLAAREAVDTGEISEESIRQLNSEPAPELVRQAENGNAAVLETLLKAGADPNVQDSLSTALHQACLGGHLDAVRVLLKYGADPNIKDPVHKGNAVGWACFSSQHAATSPVFVAMVTALLDAGGTPPETPWGSPEVQELLVQRGSKSA